MFKLHPAGTELPNTFTFDNVYSLSKSLFLMQAVVQ